MIDLLIPVLGRPANARPLVESIAKATVVPHCVIFVATRGDREQIEAAKATNSVVLLSDELGYAAKINEGIVWTLDQFGRRADDFVFLGADDLAFHPDWDRAAIDRFYETDKPVVGTNDLGNATVMAGKHATHSLVHRSYHGTIDDPTKLLHEGYRHNWVDTEFCETAMSRDAFTFAKDSHVEHLHPFWKKSDDDAIYEMGREKYHSDRRLFMSRRRMWRGRRY